jgi:hypothetical protein
MGFGFDLKVYMKIDLGLVLAVIFEIEFVDFGNNIT